MLDEDTHEYFDFRTTFWDDLITAYVDAHCDEEDGMVYDEHALDVCERLSASCFDDMPPTSVH